MRFLDAQPALQRLIVGLFKSLARFAIRHPWRALGVVLMVLGATAPGIHWLRLRTDGRTLVTAGAPEVRFDQAIREQFGIEDKLVVLVHSTSSAGIFNPGTLQTVRDLTADSLKLPGIDPVNVMSLATEPSFRFRPGTLVNQTLLEPPLNTTAELDQLREDVRRIELYTGTLVSADASSTVILIGTPPGADRTRLYQQVREIIAKRKLSGSVDGRRAGDARTASSPLPSPPVEEREKPAARDSSTPVSDEIAVTGAPVAESLLGIHILEDLGVPKAWLGTSTRSSFEQARWKMPSNFYEFRLLLAQRLGLVPVAALVMMLVFLLCFRNLLAMLLPLPGVGATMLFVFGLMGWLGVPIYLTIAVMPVLLTATGVTNDVYVFNRYFTLLREQPAANHIALLEETFDKMVSPIASTSLTASIGFLSFGFAPLEPVRAFGIFTGVGVLFGLFYSFTILPAMLRLIPPAWLRPRWRSRAGPGALGQAFAGLGLAVVRWRWWVVGLVLLTAALTPLGLRRLTIQDSWTQAFDPNSEFHRATKMVNEQFYGMHLLFVSVEKPQMLTGQLPAASVTQEGLILPGNLVEDPALIAGSPLTISIPGKPAAGTVAEPAPRAVVQSHIELAFRLGTNLSARIPRGDVPAEFRTALSAEGKADFEVVVHSQVQPEVIRALGDLGEFIRQRRQYAVGGVLSPADYISTTRFMVRPNDPGARIVPDEAGEIKLMWDYYGLARGQQRLHQIVDTNYWRSLTTVFLKDANFVDTARLMSDIRGYEREHLAPKGMSLGFAGDVALSQSLIHGIVSTQLQSLVWSVVGICLVTTVLGGSLRWGIYCVLPSLLAVVLKFAIMGWFGIPLGVATSMFAAMTLGIGVNCAIQLLEGYMQARGAGARLSQPQQFQTQEVAGKISDASPIRSRCGWDSRAPAATQPLAEPEHAASAITHAMASTGPPALINTVAVSLGFGVLMLSQVPANARLGLLVVLGLVECFGASLALLPVLLHWWPLKAPHGVTTH